MFWKHIENIIQCIIPLVNWKKLYKCQISSGNFPGSLEPPILTTVRGAICLVCSVFISHFQCQIYARAREVESGGVANEPNRPKVPGKMLQTRQSSVSQMLHLDFGFGLVLALEIFFAHCTHIVNLAPQGTNSQTSDSPSRIRWSNFSIVWRGFPGVLCLLHFCATFALLIKFDIRVPCECVRFFLSAGRENHFPPWGIWDPSFLALASLISKICISAKKETAAKSLPVLLGSYQ